MTQAELTAYLSAKPGATSSYPFWEGILVFKVGGKMFAIFVEGSDPLQITLKCDPDLALELRQQYPDAVAPGYHMNKTHWNTVTLNPTVPDEEVRDMIDHSYDRIVASLPRATRAGIAALTRGDTNDTI